MEHHDGLPLKWADLRTVGQIYQHLSNVLGGPEVPTEASAIQQELLTGRIRVMPATAERKLSSLEVLVRLRNLQCRGNQREISRDNVHTVAALGGTALREIYQMSKRGLSHTAMNG